MIPLLQGGGSSSLILFLVILLILVVVVVVAAAVVVVVVVVFIILAPHAPPIPRYEIHPPSSLPAWQSILSWRPRGGVIMSIRITNKNII